MLGVVCDKDASGSKDMHRSHFGSRYKSGCCGHAGLRFNTGSILAAWLGRQDGSVGRVVRSAGWFGRQGG